MFLRRSFMQTLCALICIATLSVPAFADTGRLRLATTTSTENSGLLAEIIPHFTAKTGIEVDVIAVGTGQALEIGRRGDAEALLVHDREGEEEFVANGFGTDRRDVMYNDFVIIGPISDPAQIKTLKNVTDAFQAIAATQSLFASRGDDSGTNRKEMRLWADAELDPINFGDWYKETGSGMGDTLLFSVESGAYTLTDRGTWISFNRKDDFEILLEQMPPLFNPYASILVTSDAINDAQKTRALSWHQWLTGPEGQTAINTFRVDGQQLFFTSGG